MKGLINQSFLSRLADKIRSRKNVDRAFTPKQMVCVFDQMPLKNFIEGDFGGGPCYIPDGVKYLRNRIFYNHEDEIILPSSLKTIEDHAFYSVDCKEFIIPSSVTSIEDYAFAHAFIKKLRFLGPLPEYIDYNAFWAQHAYGGDPTYIDEIHIPNLESWFNLRNGQHPSAGKIFINGKLAKYIEIPEGVETIRYATFRRWHDLKTVTIPASIKKIENYAFNPCHSLTRITFKGKPDSISSMAFTGISNKNALTIFVPWAEGEVEGAPWGAEGATIEYNSLVNA